MGTRRLALVALLAVICPAARADVKPNGLISDGMVLQQQTKATLWGTADPGEKITIKFRGQEATTEAGKDGRWRVQIPSQDAGGPFPLTIQGKNIILMKNVLVGEVWVCSGQSNMEWRVSSGSASDKEAAKTAPPNPMVRMFTVPRTPQDQPATDVKGTWIEANAQTTPGFSAVGYFFGRDLQATLKVPVGLINTSYGGTRAEAWTSRPVLEAHPLYKGMVEAYVKAKTPPNANSVSALYNGMIAPLIPYTIKGAIWYQGESNASQAYNYRVLFPMMIKNWRDAWGVGEFPFYFVQLAPYQLIKKEPGDSNWAELCESQTLTAKNLPNTGMAVITDLGHESDIHPTPKQPVGERLARLARARTYGEKIECCGPTFAGMKVEGNKAVVTFEHAAGLHALELMPTDTRKNKEGKPTGSAWRVKPGSTGAQITGFTVAGSDGKFHNANAKIENGTVVVWSETVSKPEAVRYGWASHPLCNLFNKDGLPAVPFRTDKLPLTTQPKQ